MRRIKYLPILLLLVFLVSCGATQDIIKVKPWDELSPQQKGAWMMNIYNTEFDSYKAVAAKPNLSNEAKEMLRIKKRVLTEVKPLITMFDTYVQTGVLPTSELEARILALLAELLVIE